MDNILNRPSQRYTEPVNTKPSRSGWGGSQAPSDLPNAPNRPNSILQGNMFSNGQGSLSRGGGGYSQAPSVMSGRSNTSRFSIFGRSKKTRQPSVSGGSVYHDGASSIAPSDVGTKSRWWEAGSLTRKNYSRPPSVAGSIFSEPDAAGPPGFPRISDSFQAPAPQRGARSDYGGPTSSRKRYSSQPALPPIPQLVTKGSMSSMKRNSGVAPLGQQAPNLMRQSSAISLTRSPSATGTSGDPARPISPAASMGRTRTQSRKTMNDPADWNSFVKSMSGTEVAKTWETMPTLAPQPARTNEKRSSMVASRVKKELEQDAQYQQIQRDPGVANQDLLARAASQVIGEMPPTPVSPMSDPMVAPPMHLQPGHMVAPISPMYSPVGSSSSINVAHYPNSMSAVMSGAGAPAPVVLPQSMAPVPVIHAPQQQQQPQQYYVDPLAAQYQHVEPVPVAPAQQYVLQPVPAAGGAPKLYTLAPVATALPRGPVEPPVQPQPQYIAPVTSLPIPVAVPAVVPEPAPAPTPAPTAVAQPPISTPAAAVAPPTTAQYLADRVEEEEESGDDAAIHEEATPEESEESDESSDDGLIGHPTLDVVAEEDEDSSSVGHPHPQHQEMRSLGLVKGKGPSRNYDDYEARLQRRQASTQEQEEAKAEEIPTAPSDVQIHVTEPSSSEPAAAQEVAAVEASKPVEASESSSLRHLQRDLHSSLAAPR